MEFSDIDKTLFAFLLALKNVSNDLEEGEKSSLNQQLHRVGQQLKLKPERWNFIKRGLEGIMSDRPVLNREFQSFLTQLEIIESKLSSEILPTDLELEQELETEQSIERRGFKPGKSQESLSQAIINDVVVPTLLSSNPPAVTQKLSFLERLQQRIQKISPDDFSSSTNP
ncbi:MAG: hypothetical protein J7647_17915 [Cyanobacteria bacterium SBLK]|nr:hypothetical protein [Cyanobacteria bacterium SBLK]